MKLRSLVVLGGSFLLLNSSSLAGTIQGYARCGLYMAGAPVLLVDVYPTVEEARKSKISVVASRESATLDGGSGYTLMKLYDDSKVKKICTEIQKIDGRRAITVSTNATGFLTSATIDGEKIESDAYFLMGEVEKARIDALVNAYLIQGWERPRISPRPLLKR